MIEVYRTIRDYRQCRQHLQRAGRSVGLVPTMGALHAGHLSLIREAAQENDHVCVSIYVNPTQFGANEDLASYPRTWESDERQLRQLDQDLRATRTKGRVEAVFMPDSTEMYPTGPPSSEMGGPGSFVNILPLSQQLEGASRPIFFRGVATVCMKLFNIVQPDRVYFGQKDIQQTFVIIRMVRDFHMDLEVRVCKTVREADGLALSSRNVYLGEQRRPVACVLYGALRAAKAAFDHGSRNASSLRLAAMEHLEMVACSSDHGFDIDYISINDSDDFATLEDLVPERAIISGAVRMVSDQSGRMPVRLIDNLYLGDD